MGRSLRRESFESIFFDGFQALDRELVEGDLQLHALLHFSGELFSRKIPQNNIVLRAAAWKCGLENQQFLQVQAQLNNNGKKNDREKK